MHFMASEVARATSGELVGPECEVSSVGIDSREIRCGELFVPIVAERDGHDFIPAALKKGASAYLTSRSPNSSASSAIRVADTSAALLAIGRAARERLAPPVVGITGSVGKTTAKDMLRSILAQRFVTTASEKSFNNELGVPLTLANATAATEATVIEMGARGIGHVALLCGVAEPTIGVVTIVAGAHLELFGSLDEVAIAKGELIEALPSSGTAVLNADDPRVIDMASRSAANVLSFGLIAGEVRAEAIELAADLLPSFRLLTPSGVAAVRLGVRGAHNVMNALAASAAALAAGCALEEVVAGLTDIEISPLRMDVSRAQSGATIINDCYNANPTSMRAALAALAALPAERRIAVVGEMAELGPDSEDQHLEIASYASSLDLRVLSVKAPAYGSTNAADFAEAVALIGDLGPADAILVKGSRVAGLERLVELLLAVG